jgi:Na+/proline symporter
MIPSYFGWIAAQLVALATVLNVLAGIPIVVGVVLCTFIVLVYTFIGGMWAVSVTDTVQTIMILIGLLFLTVKIVGDVGGFQLMVAQAPDGFFRFFPEPTFKDWIHYFAAWITIGLGSIPQQDIFQRIIAAKSEKAAVRAAYLSGVMYLTIAFLPLLIAWGGKILYQDSMIGDPQMVIPMMVLQHTGIVMQILFFGALLSAILSTTSGAMLAPATVIGENLIKPQFKQLSDKQLLMIMRWSVVFIAICSVVMAMLNADIYDLVGQSSALSLVSLFVPLTAGLYWKKATRLGALLSIVLGGLVWVCCEWIATDIPPLIYGTLASISGMMVGSLVAKDNSYEEFKARTQHQA